MAYRYNYEPSLIGENFVWVDVNLDVKLKGD